MKKISLNRALVAKKKIFTFVAALMMAASAFAVTETVSSYDFLAWATAHLEEGGAGRKNMSEAQFTAGDRFVSQTFYTINEADTLPAPEFQLFPNKQWTLTRVYSTGDLQIGIRATRDGEVSNMFGFKALKKDMKVIVLSKVAATLASAESVANVASEDQEINFSYGGKNRVETVKATTFTLLENADLAIAFAKDNVIYSVTVTEEVDDSEYVWNTLAEYAEGAVVSGDITAVGTIDMAYSSGKYNANKTSCTAITFPNSYSSTKDGVTTYNYLKVSVEGGFKAGDSLTIQPFTVMSATDMATKYANIEIRTVANGEEAAAVNITGSASGALTVTDGHEEAGDPKFFGYVIPADCDSFLLARQGGTRINLLSLSVVRRVAKEDEDPGTATAIGSVESPVKAVKMIENGQVVIFRDGIKYNVLGAQL